MPNPSNGEPNEHSPLTASGREEENCCSRCCTIFMISFTFCAFVMLLSTGLYYLLVLENTTIFPMYLLAAIFCLCEFIILVNKCGLTVYFGRRPSPPQRVPLAESLRTLVLNRTQSDGVLIDIPGRAESTLSLPVQIMVSTGEYGENLELRTSTETTQSVEGRDEESAGLTMKEADVHSFGEATETLVKVVDETKPEKVSAEVVGEGSSEVSAEAQSAVLQGVRQRKPSPMEPQKHVPLPEGEKTE